MQSKLPLASDIVLNLYSFYSILKEGIRIACLLIQTTALKGFLGQNR